MFRFFQEGVNAELVFVSDKTEMALLKSNANALALSFIKH